MSEEFEKMMKRLNSDDYTDAFKEGAVEGWESCFESMQSKLDAQAEELAALRLLLIDVVESEKIDDTDLYEMGLIDENCILVPLLTGVKE